MNGLLALLQDGHFHSGQELGDTLGVSRSSVWKHLQRVEVELGLRLYRIPGRGYRLAEPLSLLRQEGLAETHDQLGWHIYLRDTVDSTNAEALRLLLSPDAPAPFVVLAEMQTSGRGRRGRRWVSPFGQNLYYSLALKVTGGAQQLSGISLVVGLAVRQALTQMGLPEVGLKWPNDVYVRGVKVAGILLELTGDPADQCHVVVGVGVNANMLAAGEAIDQSWTSVRAEIGSLVDRNTMARTLSQALCFYLRRHASEGFAGLRLEWEACNVWVGRRCVLSTGAQQVIGVVLGVDDHGALRLLVDGHEKTFSGGELSLRLDHDS